MASSSDYVSLVQWTFAALSPFIGYACARLEKRGKIWLGWGFSIAMLTCGLPQLGLIVLYSALKASLR